MVELTASQDNYKHHDESHPLNMFVILINTNLMSFLPISALCHVQILSLSNYCDASFFSSRETSWGCLDRVGRINRITNSFHHLLANEPVSAKYL